MPEGPGRANVAIWVGLALFGIVVGVAAMQVFGLGIPVGLLAASPTPRPHIRPSLPPIEEEVDEVAVTPSTVVPCATPAPLPVACACLSRAAGVPGGCTTVAATDSGTTALLRVGALARSELFLSRVVDGKWTTLADLGTEKRTAVSRHETRSATLDERTIETALGLVRVVSIESTRHEESKLLDFRQTCDRKVRTICVVEGGRKLGCPVEAALECKLSAATGAATVTRTRIDVSGTGLVTVTPQSEPTGTRCDVEAQAVQLW